MAIDDEERKILRYLIEKREKQIELLAEIYRPKLKADLTIIDEFVLFRAQKERGEE